MEKSGELGELFYLVGMSTDISFSFSQMIESLKKLSKLEKNGSVSV